MTQKIIKVQVTSAVPISATQEDKIKSAVASKFGVKSVEISKAVDESVIGGVRLIIDSVEYDATVQTSLQKIQYQLKNKLAQ